LFQHAADGGAADLKGLGDLTETLAMRTVLQDRRPIQVEWHATDVAAFEPGAPQAGANTFDNQIAFEFGNRADDDDPRAAQWAAGVDVLAKRYELNAEMIEFVQHFQEVPHRTCQPVAARTMKGINDFEVRAIPHAELQQVLKKYNRLVELPK
jgi:hypothetical protein